MIYRQNILSINSTISTYQAQNNTEKQQLDLDTYHFLANLFKTFLMMSVYTALP